MFLLVSFALLFLWGSVVFAVDSPLEGLYEERAAIIEKVDLIRQKVQQNVDRLRPRQMEYLLFQGSINFAEDEKTLSDLRQRLKKTEEQIVGLLRRANLPDPAWVSQRNQEAIYTGAPLFSFYHPMIAQSSKTGGFPIVGAVFLFVLWGGITVVFLYGSIRRIFPAERGMLYPCLLTQREDSGLDLLYIPSPFEAGRG